MDYREKILSKIKLGLALKEILLENANSPSPISISSLRKLAAASEIEYSIIQKVSSGKKDPQFTTLLSIADGLGISLQEILEKFDNINDSEVLKAYATQKKGLKAKDKKNK